MATTQLEGTATLQTLLGDVAAALAAEGDIVRQAVQVLDQTLRATGAVECSLWLGTANGLINAARAGTVSTPAADLAPLFEAGDSDADALVVRRLAVGARRLGALVLRVEGGVPADVAAALTAIAHMLAPALAWAEQSRTWAAEAERRTRQLDEERRLMHMVVDSLPVSLYVVDREYRISVWNRKREGGSQGVSREKALGKTLFEILHRAPAEKLRKELDEVFRTGRIQQFNMETRATGESRTYRITKIPMQVADGAPISHVVTIGEDVTDVAAGQERFALSERFAAVGQRAAGVMQEVSHPLATIESCAAGLSVRLEELSRDGATVPDDARELVRSIAAEVGRCQSIVSGLVDFSRPVPHERSAVNLNQVVDQALTILKRQPGFHRFSLQAFLEDDLPPVNANGEQLLQVLLALMQNAADAMEAAGAITVRSRRGPTDADGVVLEVIDEGRGIARADQPHIFDPFFSTKGAGRGTGLGLSICHSIVTRHGGRMEVDSAVGAGSTFRILLPGAAAA